MAMSVAPSGSVICVYLVVMVWSLASALGTLV